MSQDLKPCPFCGGTPVKSKHSDNVICDCLRRTNTWIPLNIWQTRVEAATVCTCKEEEPTRKKDGRCHAPCQAGCEYKVYGSCTYNGDDGCDAQYVPQE